jgi:hypothetical protein
LLLELHKQRLIVITSFRDLKSLYSCSVLFKHINKFGSVFPNHVIHVIYKTKFPTLQLSLFPFSVARITLNCSWTLKTFLFFHPRTHIITLPISIYSRSRKVPETQKETHHNNDKYLSTGVHRLACLDCGKAYVDRTGRGFTKGFTEHQLSFINNSTTSKFVQHL